MLSSVRAESKIKNVKFTIFREVCLNPIIFWKLYFLETLCPSSYNRTVIEALAFFIVFFVLICYFQIARVVMARYVLLIKSIFFYLNRIILHFIHNYLYFKKNQS